MTERARPQWFWAHRRKASLHHFSFLMHGMRFKGWMPVANFWFDNQLGVGVPDKGSYVFYDTNQMGPGAEKWRDIQKSIDENPDFVRDFRKRSNELFGAVFFQCLTIDTENLELLSQEELHSLYQNFLDAVMVGPIISIQLWGIEACFDENYKIMQFLRARTQELNKGRELEVYKSALAVNVGETVAFTEKKNFYQVASELAKNSDLEKLFKEANVEDICTELDRFPREKRLFENHRRKYEWVNTEYTGAAWPEEKWIQLFKDAILDSESPAKKLEDMLSEFTKLNAERERAIRELDPPEDVRHALDVLSEFIAQRDWTKGYMSKALLSYHRLLDEIGNRMGITRNDLFSYTYLEVLEYLKSGKTLSIEELELRKKHGYLIRIVNGEFTIITGKEAIAEAIQEENISEPFDSLVNIKEFKGLAASRGKITGKVRVLEDASRLSELQAGEILVTYMTTIEFVPAFRKVAAVITDEGGMACHAAIISREFKLPCIVGTKVATRVLETGDMVEVDAIQGIVRIVDNT